MSSSPPSMSPLAALTEALASGAVRVVDLTQPLSESTPVLRLPEPFANTPGLTRHELSRYDERGPAWAWSWLEIGEHVGTHFDAPIHWITGRDGEDVASVPAARLVGPALVIDKSAEAAACHLVGEWLEEVEVASIDDREVDRRSGEVLCSLQAAEPATDHDHSMPLRWRVTVWAHAEVHSRCSRSRSPRVGTPPKRQGPDAGREPSTIASLAQ